MGRLTRRIGRVQVSTRLTWSFSARTSVGRRRPVLAAAAGRLVSTALLRRALGAARAHRPGAAPAPCRARRPWRR
ncbi:hypothetical protein P3T26_000545 [Streptomyces sp. MAA16]|nr:hypothetical protein [Streptomyces sp. MAA16]